jgi:hypothetical protein
MNATSFSAFFASSRPKKLLRCISFLALLFAIPLRAEDESPIPHAWPASRYEAMKHQSPFALATPIEPAEEPKASFASNWFVSGIGRLDGEDFVTIKARDLSTQFSLYGHDANSEYGVTLASIEWSDKIGKSTVVIKKGIETAKLEFNEAEIRGPAQVITAKGPGAGGNKNGAQQARTGGGQPLTPLSPYSPARPPTPNPGNPGATTPANRFPPTGQPPAGGNPTQGQDRRRIRIINAPQQ